MRLPYGVEGARQENSNGSGLSNGRSTLGIEIFEVIGREGATGGGKFGAAEIGQLFGMQLNRQAEFRRLGEDPGNLLDRKGNALAKAIDRIDEAFGVGLFEAGQDDFGDVGVISAATGVAWAAR